MKRILGLAAALFILSAAPAFAVCPATLQLKDNAGVTPTAVYVDDGSGNCQPQVVISPHEAGTPQTGQAQPTGGAGLTGWLSGIYNRLAALVTAVGAAPMQNSGGSVTANAGTNLNTSALATSANQATNAATTTHTCSVSGYSELGCLGQIDDDVKGAIPAGTNTIGNVNLAANVTPTDCSGTVATGGTATNAFTAQTTLHGFTILNDDTTEPLWISFTTTAAASTAGSYPLAPATATSFAGASSFTAPPGFGTNHALSVVATTTGHKFSCTWW